MVGILVLLTVARHRAVGRHAVAEFAHHAITALTTLAKIVESQEDPRTYAEAKLREAEALDEADAKIEALMKAGLALRDRCHDSAAAIAAFRQVLEVRRYHSL